MMASLDVLWPAHDVDIGDDAAVFLFLQTNVQTGNALEAYAPKQSKLFGPIACLEAYAPWSGSRVQPWLRCLPWPTAA